ncbi:helix-turn-helix domain-containing protein [Arsenicicoccus piscis]|uniref:ArsR family transcriptional regulator n=1 Tax=Arsenicicoccus piscis TaxID=673954 RepID=A0ABQ6HMN0_9MICO|nr:helix-turn-helix domain-containing protein [Arsenicicoccus piscis]MCH8629037.1 helix-turn-helix domain-containing protein [Arsenicicoccus piscis]GMA19656.1 hypothetical protein GCM10025862_16770 [Arsenicicoccus piscis]
MDMPPALVAARPLDGVHDIVGVLNALGHRHRLSTSRALVQSDVPLSVPQLRVRVSRPATVLDHLGTLRSAGFVEMLGQGRAAKWRVVPGSLDKAATLTATDPH